MGNCDENHYATLFIDGNLRYKGLITGNPDNEKEYQQRGPTRLIPAATVGIYLCPNHRLPEFQQEINQHNHETRN